MLVLSWHNITQEKRVPKGSFPGAYVPPKLGTAVIKIIDAQHFLTRLFLIKAYFN